MKSKIRAGIIALRLAVIFILAGSVALWSSEAAGLLGFIGLISARSYLPCAEADFYTIGQKKISEAPTQQTTAAARQTLSDGKEEKDLAVTDSDLTLIMKKAEEKSKSEKIDGEIYEYTFTDDGVTDSFGNIRVKNTNETEIDIEKKLSEEPEITVYDDKPLVLIYHTHTTETYQLLDRGFYAEGFLSRSSDENLNMIRVGKAVKEEIENMGYGVIHDTSVYDNPYTGAYYRSMDGAEKILEKYPSVQITIDLHRDAIQNDEGVKTKPTAVIDGKKAAQVMIITGCQEEGNGITDLPDWEKNLTFALKLQQSMETMFPGLTRPVFFCPRSYNMSLTPCSLLVEVGTDANTLEEAVYSGKMLGRAIGRVIENSQ
ncbi:MAG: stage II sporulation protein P [Clostridia bacterium]|nr:stage II sporulation protein P [Clostridia bacterium]